MLRPLPDSVGYAWANPGIAGDLPGVWQPVTEPDDYRYRGIKRFGEPLVPAGFRPPYVRNHCYAAAHGGTS
jgi:hypothetical protein